MSALGVRTSTASDVLVGREPIFDRALVVHGYELLFRHPPGREPTMFDGNAATAEVVVNAFTEFGIESVVGDKPAFINSTRDFLLTDAPRLLPRGRVVLEVNEGMVVDAALVRRVAELVDDGFSIALDDYRAEPQWEPLLQHAHIVKIDVPQLCDDRRRGLVERLHGRGVIALAEKVETENEFESLRAMGYDLFQGNFLANPRLLDRQFIPAGGLGALRLAVQLQGGSTPVDVEQLIASDPSLSFRLIRFVNSSPMGLPAAVPSVRQAVEHLGIGEVRRLAALVSMAGFHGRPPELLRVALVRARTCEGLARVLGGVDPAQCYTVGLFSTLGGLLQRPVPTVLRELPIAEEVGTALVGGAGPMGDVLRAALALERLEGVEQPSWDLAYEDAHAIHLAAVAWAEEQYRRL